MKGLNEFVVPIELFYEFIRESLVLRSAKGALQWSFDQQTMEVVLAPMRITQEKQASRTSNIHRNYIT